MRAGNRSPGPSLCPSEDYSQTPQSTGHPVNTQMCTAAENVLSFKKIDEWESRDLSGETIGICLGGRACKESAKRLVGGLGLSAFVSDLGSVIVSAGLGVTVTFSADRSKPEMCIKGGKMCR